MMISIVMATWNRKKFLIETIDSVLNQTYKDFEFIIVDDGSTDGAVDILKFYSQKDSRIKLILKKHTGCTNTFNAGFKKVKGDAVCVLGSDDVWLPNKLQKQVEINKQYPDYILHNNSIEIDDTGKILNLTMYHDLTQEETIQKALYGPSHSWFVTSSWFIPRKIFDKVGLWKGIYNDYEWMERAIIMHDFKLKLITDYITLHRSNPDSNTFKNIGQQKFIDLGKIIQNKMLKFYKNKTK